MSWWPRQCPLKKRSGYLSATSYSFGAERSASAPPLGIVLPKAAGPRRRRLSLRSISAMSVHLQLGRASLTRLWLLVLLIVGALPCQRRCSHKGDALPFTVREDDGAALAAWLLQPRRPRRRSRGRPRHTFQLKPQTFCHRSGGITSAVLPSRSADRSDPRRRTGCPLVLGRNMAASQPAPRPARRRPAGPRP